jgi:hypothetical protein
LLQAVIKPATARIANTFFIVLVFGFFYLVAKIVYYDIYAKIFTKFLFFSEKYANRHPFEVEIGPQLVL